MLCFRSAVKVAVIWIALCALGFPLGLHKRGGINFYSPFYPLLCGSLGPGRSGYFTLLLSDYLLFSFLWCSYIWAWSAVNATERLMFALVRLYLYKGRGWRCLSGFWVFFVLFSSLRSISSELYSTITCCHCILLPIIQGERGAALSFNTSSLTLYVSLCATWEKVLAV